MGGWEWAIYLALTYLASQRKKQAYDRGLAQQRAIRADNEAKRLALERQTSAKRKDLLTKLDPANVTKDAIVKSQRIQNLQKEMSQPTGDKLISGGSPQIVKTALEKALGDVTANVSKRGLAKANLDSRANPFAEYAPELTDAQVQAQNVASKLKGNEAVMNIGVNEAGETYDQPGDIISEIAKLYGLYAMGQGKDPKIVS